MQKKLIILLFCALFIFICPLRLFAAGNLETGDIKITGLQDVTSLETKWDNPNAWSLEDEADIVKVIFTQLIGAGGKKLKKPTYESELTISIHIPEAYRKGYEDSAYSIVVFDGTRVREHIDAVKDGDWLTFNWDQVEDFGIVVKGATNGEAGVLTLVGQSRETIASVDFKRLFRILGITAAVCLPFMTIYSWRRVKKEMREEYEARKKELQEEEEAEQE